MRESAGYGKFVPLILLSPALLASVFFLAQGKGQHGWFWIDGLGLALAWLVCGVGAACLRFGLVHMRGEAGLRTFVIAATIAVLSASLLVLSSHLLVLFGVWFATSIAVDTLLRYHPERLGARLAANGKFLASRLGDMALVGAIGIAWQAFDTFSIPVLLEKAAATDSVAENWFVFLLVVAALAKSAQFPFHTWLVRTLEAPTPVSALLHAGIVNAGSVLLLRFAPMVAESTPASFLLLAVGSVSVFYGMSGVWTRPDIKGALAWSTVAQMGFVMIEVGLGAYGAAAIHVLAHGMYKAWSFLDAGEVRPTLRNRTVTWTQAALRLGLAGGILLGGGAYLGQLESVRDGVLLLVVALAFATWTPGGVNPWLRLTMFSVWWLVFHALIHAASPVYNPWATMGPLAWLGFGLVVLSFGICLYFQVAFSQAHWPQTLRKVYVHMTRGWYFESHTQRWIWAVRHPTIQGE